MDKLWLYAEDESVAMDLEPSYNPSSEVPSEVHAAGVAAVEPHAADDNGSRSAMKRKQLVVPAGAQKKYLQRQSKIGWTQRREGVFVHRGRSGAWSSSRRWTCASRCCLPMATSSTWCGGAKRTSSKAAVCRRQQVLSADGNKFFSVKFQIFSRKKL